MYVSADGKSTGTTKTVHALVTASDGGRARNPVRVDRWARDGIRAQGS